MASISDNYILSDLCRLNLFAILSYWNIVVALLLSIPCNMTIPVSSMEATPSTSSTLHISAACNTTLYPKTCLATLLPFAAVSAHPKDFFHHSLKVAIDDAGSARGLSLKLKRKASGESRPTAIDDCAELLDVSFCQLCDVRDHGRRGSLDDVRTWLSAALTNQQTCIDSLADLHSENADLAAWSGNVSELISNSLALFLHAGGTDDVFGGGRKLLEFGGYSRSLFPAWTTAAERKLLGASPEEMGDRIVVAKDGSGAYSTIVEAVAAAKKDKKSGGGRVVIYVKAGVYKENVKIHAAQKNVMLVGDGRGKTVITSDRSAADGWTTFQSATFGEHQTDLAFRFYP